MSILKWFSSDGILNNITCGDYVLKTEKQYFKEAREEAKKDREEREEKQRQKYLEEIKDWDIEKLRENYVNVQLARTIWAPGISSGTIWDLCKDECCVCGLEYIYGHENYCDDCFEKNKHKTLEELENE